MQITFKVHQSDLALLDALADPEIKRALLAYVDGHRWLTSPKISVSRDAFGLLSFEFCGEHWKRSSRNDGLDRAKQNGAAAEHREADTGGRTFVGMTVDHIARCVALLIRMINPLANSNARKSGGDHGGVRPASGDSGNEASARNARQPLPPVQVFSDAGNVNHAGQTIPRFTMIQGGAA